MKSKTPTRTERTKAADETVAFEKAVAEGWEGGRYVLRLYVTGATPRSARAIRNIRTICEEKLAGHYDLEVIDIYQHPEEIKPEHLVATPTLVRKLPLPVRKLIGDLSDHERVLIGLEIVPRKLPKPGDDGHAL